MQIYGEASTIKKKKLKNLDCGRTSLWEYKYKHVYTYMPPSKTVNEIINIILLTV